MQQWQRTGHKIRRNHSNALPRMVIAYNAATKFAVTDGVTRTGTHNFRLGVAISAKFENGVCGNPKLTQVAKPADFWKLIDKLTSVHHTTWVVSYNALFDMVVTGLPQEFVEAKLSIDWPRAKRTREGNDESDPHCQGLCVIENPPTIIACRQIRTGGRLVIVDLLNWFNCPLTDIANSVGIVRTERPKETDPELQHWEHCKSDCEVVFLSFTKLMEFVKLQDFGMFRYTSAAQSMSAYRHRFMEHQISVHDNLNIKQLERRGYYGGRTEVFRLGRIGQTCYQLDVNSLFPSIMRTCESPHLLHRFDDDRAFTCNLPDIDYPRSIAEVDISTNSSIYPDRTGGITTYPIGCFRTVLAGRELELAKDNGCICAVGKWAEYKTANLFTLFVDTLWKMRQEYKAAGNLLYDLFTKRLMNSLYGKFGQRAPKWQNVNDSMAALPWSRWTVCNETIGDRTEYRSIGWQIQKRIDDAELEGSFIAIAAFITAAARVKMNKYRRIAGVGNVYYQGIDSLVVTQTGIDNLRAADTLSDTELGKLRLQLAFNDGEIYGCNDYRLGSKVVVSGRSSDWELSDQGLMLQRKLGSVGYLFNGEAINSVPETITDWSRIGRYTKGTVGDNGWISPHVRRSPEQLITEIAEHASDNRHSGNVSGAGLITSGPH